MDTPIPNSEDGSKQDRNGGEQHRVEGGFGQWRTHSLDSTHFAEFGQSLPANPRHEGLPVKSTLDDCLFIRG